MCKSLRQSRAAPVLHLVTDSILAIQLLFGASRSVTDVVLDAQLSSNWHGIGHATQVSCILPTVQALHHAKLACLSGHTQLETFFLDGTYGSIGVRPAIQELPLSAFSHGDFRI